MPRKKKSSESEATGFAYEVIGSAFLIKRDRVVNAELRVVETQEEPIAMYLGPEEPDPPILDYDGRRLWHDGHWDDLSDPEAEMFKTLFEKKGEWVNLNVILPNSARPAQVRFRMKHCLKTLIESHTRKGYRLR